MTRPFWPLLLLVLALTGLAQPRAEAAKLRILVPAYFYPAGDGLKEWDRLLRSPGLENTIVIVNPASGPGKASDPNYLHLLERIRKTPLTVIAYVTTSYARRATKEVKADIDQWLKLYPGIRGIFFDEQASGAEHKDYYGELYDYVRKEKHLALAVNNPGTICDESYFSRPAADAICFFEGPYKPTSAVVPPWIDRYPAPSKYFLPYAVGTSRAMKEILKNAAAKGFGVVYVTDATGVNPWRRLPRYWEDEALEVVRLNAGG